MSGTSFIDPFNVPPGYGDAVAALEAFDSETHGEAVRVYAQATAERKREQYARARGARLSTATPCVFRLAGHGHPRSLHVEYGHGRGVWPDGCRPPGADHLTMWTKGGRPYSIVSRPYKLSARDIRALADMTEALGLDVSISSCADFYFPGAVVGVEITRKGEA